MATVSSKLSITAEVQLSDRRSRLNTTLTTVNVALSRFLRCGAGSVPRFRRLQLR